MPPRPWRQRVLTISQRPRVAGAPPARGAGTRASSVRELRCAAEAAVDRVERCADAARPPRRARAARARDRRDGHRRAAPARCAGELRRPGCSTSSRLVLSRLGDRLQHAREARPARGGRSAGSRCRRRTAAGPASGTRSSASRPSRSWLDGGHVDVVEVGALLAVDLDADTKCSFMSARSASSSKTRAPSRGTSGRPE